MRARAPPPFSSGTGTAHPSLKVRVPNAWPPATLHARTARAEMYRSLRTADKLAAAKFLAYAMVRGRAPHLECILHTSTSTQPTAARTQKAAQEAGQMLFATSGERQDATAASGAGRDGSTDARLNT